jgi:segregation and condensation protein B
MDAVEEKLIRTPAELMAIVEALIFVSEEPITPKALADVLNENKEAVQAAIEELKNEYEERGGGLQRVRSRAAKVDLTRTGIRRGPQISKDPSLPSSLASLETLAIAYKQPVTAPEILRFASAVGLG